MTVNDSVRQLVVDVARDLSVQLYDLEHHGGVVRVTLDRAGGIDVDTLATANRALSRALDEADVIPGSYQLEVTSPGVERDLRTSEHWGRAVGERVKVKTIAGTGGERRIEGIVAGADGEAVKIDCADGQSVTVRLADVERARTSFEWGPAPKPGTGQARTSGGPSGGRERKKATR